MVKDGVTTSTQVDMAVMGPVGSSSPLPTWGRVSSDREGSDEALQIEITFTYSVV